MRDDFRLYRLRLKKHGYFSTRARFELFRAFRGYEAMSIAKIIKRVPNRDPSSVYRNLKLFEELGIIKRVDLGRNTKYELSELFREHHHHLFCTSCGKTIKMLEHSDLEAAIERLSKQAKFHMVHHQLEVMGLCDYCHRHNIADKVGIKH